jgi:murein DD-endopeptidase MepM/ murein hydrolase activator NlpD
MAAPAWYTYPRIDNFGQIDPQGPYFKPDTNILTPPGHPVTALLSGVVTNVRRTDWGQQVVTVKLDRAINGLATHTFFEHMHDALVQPGQRVNPGTLIGHANYTGEGANLGFGLYSGDVYGSGSAWDVLQRDLAPGGKGLLNPVPVIKAAQQGKVTQLSSMDTSGSNPISDLVSSPVQDALVAVKHWGEYIAVFVLAVILIVVGFLLLDGKV